MTSFPAGMLVDEAGERLYWTQNNDFTRPNPRYLRDEVGYAGKHPARIPGLGESVGASTLMRLSGLRPRVWITPNQPASPSC